MSDEDLPKHTYGVEYDQQMYLANDRYATFVDKEISKVKEIVRKANKHVKKEKTKQQTKKNKQGKKSRKRRRRRKKRTQRRYK